MALSKKISSMILFYLAINEDVLYDMCLKVVMKNDHSKNFMRMNFSRTAVDINKVKSLGWKLSFSIEEGFKRTV
jgi:hypothetical protein